MYIRNIGLVALGALSVPVSAQGSSSDKVDQVVGKQLTAAKKSGWTSVIVRTESAPTAAQEAALKARGGDVYRHLPIINSVALPFVTRVSADMDVKKTDEFTVEGGGAKTAWSYGLRGTRIDVKGEN